MERAVINLKLIRITRYSQMSKNNGVFITMITTLNWDTDWSWKGSRDMLTMDFKVRPISMGDTRLKGNARVSVLALGLVNGMIQFLRLIKIYLLRYTGLQLLEVCQLLWYLLCYAITLSTESNSNKGSL